MKRIIKKVKKYIQEQNNILELEIRKGRILYHIFSLEKLIARINANRLPYNLEYIEKEILSNYRLLQLEPFKMKKKEIEEKVKLIHLEKI